MAALPAACMLVLSPTPASAFGWCSSYSTSRAVVAPRARVYGYTAIRPYRVQAQSTVGQSCGGVCSGRDDVGNRDWNSRSQKTTGAAASARDVVVRSGPGSSDRFSAWISGWSAGVGRQADRRQALVSEVRIVGRLPVKGGMRAASILEIEIAPDPVASRADAVVGVQVDLLVFHAAPHPTKALSRQAPLPC